MTISKDKPSSPASAEHAQSKRESSLEKNFHEWAAEWKRETGHLSVAAKLRNIPPIAASSTLGEPAIPFILDDLREKPNHWFLALSAIANEAPEVAESDKGDMRAISEAWIQLGRDRGYTD